MPRFNAYNFNAYDEDDVVTLPNFQKEPFSSTSNSPILSLLKQNSISPPSKTLNGTKKSFDFWAIDPLVENTIMFYLKASALLVAIVLMVMVASFSITRMRNHSPSPTKCKKCKQLSSKCKCPGKIKVFLILLLNCA